jgi:dienelactone hydrolase
MTVIRVPYEYDGQKFEGRLVHADGMIRKRPGVFMQPDWLGVCAHSTEMAEEVAGDDYVVMMADMYGAEYGDVERSFEQLGVIARGKRADLPFILGCGDAAWQALTTEADRRGLIDTRRMGAIGYCMGGGFALEQARFGAPFKGTVVFHVTAPNPVDPPETPAFKGRVLALHGAADPVTPKPMMDALESELDAAGVDWQIMLFGHALHSFCDKGASHPVQRYDEKLCRQSYRMMRDFFAETF